MIRIALPIQWPDCDNPVSESAWVTETRARIDDVIAQHPGYASHDLEVDDVRNLLWLRLTPMPDYEMDEGL